MAKEPSDTKKGTPGRKPMLWTAEMDALLGTVSDEQAALVLKRRVSAVAARRRVLKRASYAAVTRKKDHRERLVLILKRTQSVRAAADELGISLVALRGRMLYMDITRRDWKQGYV